MRRYGEKFEVLNEGLKKVYKSSVLKFFEKLGFPPESIIINGFIPLVGLVANTFVVDLGGLKLVIKHDPATVPLEIKCLKVLGKKFPDFFPKLVDYDERLGVMLMPYYPMKTLHEIVMDPQLPKSVKLRCFERAVSVLINVIYEGTLREGVTDPHSVHLERIARVYKWANENNAEGLLKKQIYVNGAHIGSFCELMEGLTQHEGDLISNYKTFVLGDEHLANILCSLTPPASRIIFIDLPNAAEEDPAKGWGKIVHWIQVFGALFDKLFAECRNDLISSDLRRKSLDELVKKTTHFRLKETNQSVKMFYKLPIMPLADEMMRVLEENIKQFAERRNDQRWSIRYFLGWARADLGGLVHQRSYTLSLILLAEGMQRLKRVYNLLLSRSQTDRNCY